MDGAPLSNFYWCQDLVSTVYYLEFSEKIWKGLELFMSGPIWLMVTCLLTFILRKLFRFLSVEIWLAWERAYRPKSDIHVIWCTSWFIIRCGKSKSSNVWLPLLQCNSSIQFGNVVLGRTSCSDLGMVLCLNSPVASCEQGMRNKLTISHRAGCYDRPFSIVLPSSFALLSTIFCFLEEHVFETNIWLFLRKRSDFLQVTNWGNWNPVSTFRQWVSPRRFQRWFICVEFLISMR